MGDLAGLGLDQHVRAQHSALTSSAPDHAIAVADSWLPWAVDDTQEAQGVDDAGPEH
jgi:hypothetical protein